MMTKTDRTKVEQVTTWIGSISSLVVHTIIFMASFILSVLHIVSWSFMLLVLTTLLSLEAIYLAIFIQMTVNRQAFELAEVSEDVEDIQEDIQEITEDVEDIQEDIEEISEEDAHGRASDQQAVMLASITKDIRRLLEELEELKEKYHSNSEESQG